MPKGSLNNLAISATVSTVWATANAARAESWRIVLPQMYCDISYINCGDIVSGGAG